jgi:hypothetical protein
LAKGKPNAKYIRFTEELNGVDYLEKAYAAIQRLPRDSRAWKWVVIGLHGALYSFAICAIKGTDWTRVTKPGTRRLIPFDEAIKRCQTTDWTTMYMRSRPLELMDDQKDAIRFLKGVRNQLEHYAPLAWSIEAHGLVTGAIDALDVVHALVFDTGNVRLDTAQRQTADVCIRKGKQLLQATQLYKDHVAAVKRKRRKAAHPG